MGSNQVLLGGMMAPASDTAIRSSTSTGIQRKRYRRAPGVDELFELARSTRAADELDARVGSHVLDLQHGRQQLVLQHADIERGDRVGVVASRVRPQRVPRAL